MKKRFVITFCIMVISMIMMSVNAFALTEGDWEFQLLDNEVTITKYNGTDENIVVPDTLAGTPVTKVKYIRESSSLTANSITFPSSVKSINCIVSNYHGRNNSVTTIVLPEGLEELGGAAFYDFQSLKNITLPSTLKTIGSSAFSGCSSLTEINFPANLESMGESTFFDCASLISVDMSACQNLKLKSHVFSGCSSLESVKLPPNEENVPYCCFYDCSNLKYVDIPNSVTRIDIEAFANCTSLESIILPTSLKEIKRSAFYKCNFLEVIIPYGTEQVNSAFTHCDILQAVFIPDTVTDMSKSVIDGSDNCIIYCTAGSTAASVCAKNSVSYLTDDSVNSLITVLYNGRRVSFHSYGQNPEIINDRTLVPLRAIFEAMNADVEWDQATQTVTATRNGTTVKITIGENKLYKNAVEISVDVPAQIVNDRTMVPARVIAESFGANVEWNGNGRTVLITE